MNLSHKILLSVAVTVAIAVTIYALASFHVQQLSAQVTQGQVATSSTIAVGPQLDKTLFTGNPVCINRVISTAASAILLSFDSSAVNPSGSLGFVQPASTTVSYEASKYGCGAITAFAYSSSTITTAEFR